MLDVLLVWSPIVVSITALIVSLFFSWTNQVDRKLSARLAREKDLHNWAGEIGKVYVALRVGDEDERLKASALLSVLLDYGRMMFPNDMSLRLDTKYPKGLRSSVLDPLVETLKRCEKNDWTPSKLREDWREFTDQLRLRSTAFAVDTSPEAKGLIQYRNS